MSNPNEETKQEQGAAPDDRTLDTIRSQIGEHEPDPFDTIKHVPQIQRMARRRISSQIALREKTIVESAHPDGVPPEYEMGDEMARGGMGIVYNARQTSLDRMIALKMISPEKAEDQLTHEEFLSEAVVTGNLEHPNIVPVHDVAMNAGGGLFFAMQRVLGRSWKERLPDLDLMENLDILLRVADAVSYAHDHGVIHRDLKPANVLLGEYGEVFLTDWGVAADVDGISKADPLPDDPQLCGTPMYMAPEMASGNMRKIGKHSDIYLLGAILYEVVNGRPPRKRQQKFWDCIAAVLTNHIEPSEERGELMSIALKAMAMDPRDRYPDVKVFQREVRAYRTHVESDRLTVRATGLLERARARNDYPLFIESVNAFRQAMTLWPQNQVARVGLEQSLLAHAELALQRKEHALALSLLDNDVPVHAGLLARCRRQMRNERTKIRRQRRMFLLLWAAGLAIVVLLGLLALDYYHRFGRWELVYAKDFTRPGVQLDDLAFHLLDYTREVDSSPCDINGLHLRHLHMFRLRDVRESGNVRLDVWMRWPQCVDGAELLLNSDVDQVRRFPDYPTGYFCQFGGWRGEFSAMFRQSGNVHSPLNYITSYSFVTGRVYRLSYQRQGKMLSQWVDGRKIHENQWIMPLVGNNPEGVAVRAWVDIDILALRVYRMGRPRKASPVLIGDALYTAGNHRAALKEYRLAAKDFPNSAMAREAVAKAYLTACILPAGSDMEAVKDELRQWMATRYPNAAERAVLLEGDCLVAWNKARYDEVFRLLDEIYRIDPNRRTPLLILNERDPSRNEQIPSQATQRLLERIGRMKNVAYLDIGNLSVRDLTPLRNMHLDWLNCNGNQIESLTPLRGKKILKLDCAANLLTSLDGLQGMPLTQLNCDFNQLANLSPVRDCPLRRISFSHNRIKNLSPLRDMRLECLECAGNDLIDLRHIQVDRMRRLLADHNRLTHLEDLRGKDCAIERLVLQDNAISSLEPLRGSNIKELDISWNHISDLSPLRGMELEELMITGNPVVSLEPLRGMPIKKLVCEHGDLTSLTPVKGMPLRHLVCNRNAITNLTPLAFTQLHTLDCSGNRVTNLEPLAELPLKELNCRHNWIRDLSPLESMPLHILDCRDNPIEQDAILEKQPLQLIADFHAWPEASFERRIMLWREMGLAPKRLDMRRRIRAVLAGDRKKAQELAAMFDGRLYLFLRMNTLHEEAGKLARELGGHLVTIATVEEWAFVRTLFQDENTEAWIGLTLGPDGQDVWVTGEPVLFEAFRSTTDRNSDLPRKVCPFLDWRWISSIKQGWCSGFIVEWKKSE